MHPVLARFMAQQQPSSMDTLLGKAQQPMDPFKQLLAGGGQMKPTLVSDPNKPISPRNGLVEEGNIDVWNRPQVQNEDGSISTVRSMSFFDEDSRAEVLVPTVSDDGRIMSDDEAVENYYRTGRHLGKFDTPETATRYAEGLHKAQEQFYLGGKKR